MYRIGCYQYQVADSGRISNGPLQRLLAAQRPADDHRYFFDAEMVGQQRVGSGHVADRKLREGQVIRVACGRVDAQWVGGAIRRSDDVGTNDEMFLWVEQVLFAEQSRPPFKYISIRGECMAYPNHIVLPCIELAVGTVPNGEISDPFSTFEFKRFRNVECRYAHGLAGLSGDAVPTLLGQTPVAGHP